MARFKTIYLFAAQDDYDPGYFFMPGRLNLSARAMTDIARILAES